MVFPHDPDDDAGTGPPLHPDDRLWRHPSEMAAAGRGGRSGEDADVGRGGHESAGPVGTPRIWTMATVGLVVGVAATLAVLSVVGTFDESPVTTVVEQVETALPTNNEGIALVAEQVGPALVRVDATREGTTRTATGVVFRSDGHLLTTADAVEGADAISVTTADATVLAASVVGIDHSTDLAVLDVDRDGMATAVIGRVADLDPGAQTVALEREPDADTPAVAAGHVSAVGLRIDTTDGGTLHDMIQAALETSPSSGGAVLCSRDGAVLGLVTSRQPAPDSAFTSTSASVEGSTTTTVAAPAGLATRYATPIDYATQLAAEIIATGTVRHTWLGVLGDDLDPSQAAALGRSGATLTRVMPDGPAAAAGMEEGDVVLAIDGVQVTSMSSLVVALRSLGDGETVSVSYVRDGQQRHAMVTLTSRG
ncbi:MAG TPA: trypsin-like peptidase domain-containing protein [Acidimicrobiales bacterium]